MATRREWIKATMALAGGITLTPTDHLLSAPINGTEKEFLERYGDLPVNLRLGSNENPYGPSDKAREAIVRILAEGNRYPFSEVGALKARIAEKEGVTPDHIAIGAGSSELLCATGAAFGLKGGRILSCYPTYPTLMLFSEMFESRWDKVDVNDKLECDYTALASAIRDDTKLVFVCNPNNPTGTFTNPSIVRAFCEEISRKVPVFSDEAYLEFMEPSQQDSMIDLVRRDKDVIVSRTFSKIYGLAGLRVGYVVARPDIIRKISACQSRLSNNQTGIAAAAAVLGDEEFMTLSRTRNAGARKVLSDYLDKKGYRYGKSHTNFILFDPDTDASKILARLAERGARIRTWEYQQKQWLRVSIGTAEEMKLFVRLYNEVA